MRLIDFSLVDADDRLLDEIGLAAVPDPDLFEGADEVRQVVLSWLLAWRLDVDAEPIGGLIEQDEAVDVVRRAARKRSA